MIDERPQRHGPNGLFLLLGLIALGMSIPAFFLWKVDGLNEERERILAEAPNEPEERLKLWFRDLEPRILEVLLRSRFSAEQPWIVSHVVAPEGPDVPPEIWGVETAGIGPEDTFVDGLSVRVVLPAPKLLARDVLVGDNALGVEVFAPPGPKDARVLVRERLERVLRPLIDNLPRDIPGARISVEVGGLVD